MADQTEAKLLTDLQFFVNQISTLGAAFAPPNGFAMPAAIQAKIDAATPVVPQFEQKSAIESAKRHDRADMYNALSPLCTDIINYCKSAGWAKNDLDRLKSFSRELKGRPAKGREDDPATPGIDESKAGSSPAQTSYPSRAEHFANYVETLRVDAGYTPTEKHFQLATLDGTTAALRQINTDVAQVATDTDSARTALDAPLYTDADNAVDAANSAKTYLAAAFKDSQVYNNVKRLKFKKPSRLK